MPLAKKRAGESRDEFISRCMGNSTMVSEFPNTSQRYAVCISKSKENIFKDEK